ncbi:MAG: hypothetical protein EBQ96_07605 [Proteobacteria bacterium]|nr:hypothetical protein [Pseudomonadota bacterium]
MLTACAGARTFDGTMQARYVGQPISMAIADFGTPKGPYEAKDGGQAYVWQKRDSESIFGPAVTKGEGYSLFGIPWQGVTYHRCVIRANAKGGVISAIRFEGAPRDCEVITGYRKKSVGRKQDTNGDF